MSLSNAEAASLPQGDLRLLGTATAQRPLTAPLVARLAYAGKDGTPRLIPVNFLWTSEEVVIGAFAGSVAPLAGGPLPSAGLAAMRQHRGGASRSATPCLAYHGGPAA
jgi:hypothetical protein